MPDVVAGVAVAPTKQTKDDSIHVRRATRASDRLRNPRDVIDMVGGSGQLRQARRRREIVIRLAAVDHQRNLAGDPQHALDPLRRRAMPAEMRRQAAGVHPMMRGEQAANEALVNHAAPRRRRGGRTWRATRGSSHRHAGTRRRDRTIL